MEAGDDAAAGPGGMVNGICNDTQVVFQCESCGSIIGDATNWIAATELLEAFTLSAVTESVGMGEALHHSTQNHDAGSSYSILTCKNCNTELGRHYVTTPSHLDHLRNNYTFYVAMVTSYQLGSAKVRSTVDCHDPPLLFKLAERCMKLQHLIVTMNERLSAIEQCLKDNNNPQ